MAQKLDEFVEEQEILLSGFKKWWLRNNKEKPDLFPLEMPEGNDGLWFEMLSSFRDYDSKTVNEGFYD